MRWGVAPQRARDRAEKGCKNLGDRVVGCFSQFFIMPLMYD